MHVANSEFLTQLGKLLESSPSSMFVTQKRMPSAHADVEMGEAVTAPATGTGMEGGQHAVLVRVTDGKTEASKRVKLGTVVAPSDLASFTSSYLGLIRSCLSQNAGLKPRTRAKHIKPDARKREPNEQGAKAKRRSAGRRKYQRQEAHKANLRRQRALAKPVEHSKVAEARAAQREAEALFTAGETFVPGATTPETNVGTAGSAVPAASSGPPQTGAGPGTTGKKKGKKGKKGGR